MYVIMWAYISCVCIVLNNLNIRRIFHTLTHFFYSRWVNTHRASDVECATEIDHHLLLSGCWLLLSSWLTMNRFINSFCECSWLTRNQRLNSSWRWCCSASDALRFCRDEWEMYCWATAVALLCPEVCIISTKLIPDSAMNVMPVPRSAWLVYFSGLTRSRARATSEGNLAIVLRPITWFVATMTPLPVDFNFLKKRPSLTSKQAIHVSIKTINFQFPVRVCQAKLVYVQACGLRNQCQSTILFWCTLISMSDILVQSSACRLLFLFLFDGLLHVMQGLKVVQWNCVNERITAIIYIFVFEYKQSVIIMYIVHVYMFIYSSGQKKVVSGL